MLLSVREQTQYGSYDTSCIVSIRFTRLSLHDRSGNESLPASFRNENVSEGIPTVNSTNGRVRKRQRDDLRAFFFFSGSLIHCRMCRLTVGNVS